MKDSEDREPFEEACDDDSDPNDEDEDIDNPKLVHNIVRVVEKGNGHQGSCGNS